MEAQDRDTLKSYFTTGSTPTEEQFSTLIDSVQLSSDTVSMSQVEDLTTQLNAKADAVSVEQQLSSKADISAIDGYIIEYLADNPPRVDVDNVIDNEIQMSQREINQHLSQDISNVRSDANAAVSKLRSDLNNEPHTETPTWNLRYHLLSWDDYSVGNYKTAYEDENADLNAVAVELTQGANIMLTSSSGRFILATKSGTNGCICLAMFENKGNDSPYEVTADGTYYIFAFTDSADRACASWVAITTSNNGPIAKLSTQLAAKADQSYVDTQLASRSGLLHIGEVSSEDDFFSRIATHAIVTNPAAQVVTATYKSGSGTGTLVALQQIRANTSGDGGGTTMQYIYCNKSRYTRYIDFTASSVSAVQSMQPDGVRNLQYDNGVLSLRGIWGAIIGSTVNLTSVDKTAIREGTSTTDKVQLTVTKPFGNTASAYISAATSAKAGIMTAEMYNTLVSLPNELNVRINELHDQLGYYERQQLNATQGTITIATSGLSPSATVDISDTGIPDYANLSQPISLSAGKTIEVETYCALLVQQTESTALCVAYGSNVSYTNTSSSTKIIYIYNEAFPLDYDIISSTGMLADLQSLSLRLSAIESRLNAL